VYLVTGGAGFIGSNIAAALAQRGEDVVISDWLGCDDKWRNLSGVRLHEIVFPEDLPAWFADHGSGLKAIVHMGAISSTTESDVDRIVRDNIQLSLWLWRRAAEHRLPLIYASSAATYGDGGHGFEDDEAANALAKLMPLNAYGWSKHVIDRRFVGDVDAGRPRPPQWAGLKFFNVYGPNEGHKGDMRSVIHKTFQKIAAGETVELYKSHRPGFRDGEQLRDFVYVKDCVDVVLWLLETPGVSGLFNVGTGKARSFRDLAAAVGAALDCDPEIRYVDMPSTIRDRYQYFTEADVGKLARLGYPNKWTSLENGVHDYVVRHLSRHINRTADPYASAAMPIHA
jgi:ADP-L-glycero-D-manno-heptose 6-epimerase